MSSEVFEVGEVATFQHAEYFPAMNGQDVVIDAPMGFYPVVDPVTRYCKKILVYGITLPDGLQIYAAPYQLRKKPRGLTEEQKAVALFDQQPVKQPEFA